MVNTGRAIVFFGENTTRVPTPALVTSRYRNAQRSILELSCDPVDIVFIARECNPSPVPHLRRDHFVVLVPACAVFSLVLVGCVSLRADFLGHLPVVVHPATVAATRSRVTVDTFLLREAHWLRVLLDGLHSFLHCSCSEGPAGTAASLALDIAQVLCVSPIFVLGVEVTPWWREAEHATSARAWFPVVALRLAFHILSWQLNALHLKELFRCQVCCLVQSKSCIGCVGLEAPNDGLVLQIDSNAVSQLFSRLVVLVVFSCETQKFSLRVVAW